MSNAVTSFDAKTHFSKLLERAETAAINLRKLAKEVNANPGDWEEWQNYKHLGRK